MEKTMKKALLLILASVAILVMVGCSQPASAAEQKSDKPRNSAPAVIPDDQARLVEGNSTFALDLYKYLKDTQDNLFYSPYSISEALAMTYGGAKGNTEQQMAAVMHFLVSQEKLHPGFNAIDIELAKRGQGAQGTDGKGFRLKTINAAWGQSGFKFTDQYLDLLAQNYGAGMRIVDYINAAEEARQKINNWVYDQTEQKIKDLLPQGSVDALTRLVLTNAIYFNAAWATQFDKLNTADGQFHLLNGSTVTVPMMKQSMKSYRYTETEALQAIELPYDGNELSMVIILPKADQFKNFESDMSYEKLKGILDSLKSEHVNLTMPKFKVEATLGLSKALKDLGMTDAFDPDKADLSGMNGEKDLYISDVIHKSYITVDEAGTEAAAATAVIIGTTSMPLDIKDMTLDHPFAFLIRDNATGSILFMGRVLNPGN
jgi:serpin B